MSEPLPVLAGIVAAGALAQWIAWRLRVPAILLLLLTGVVVGPVAGVLDPDALFGELLFPVVSLAVAVILFEGGLTLDLTELRRAGASAVRNLVTVGAAVAGAGIAVAARWTLGLDWTMAALLGAILLVTGPTVIGPMLAQVRPARRVASILKWEGILIDPVGATVAVLVFEALIEGESHGTAGVIAAGIARTALVGSAIGLAGAALVVAALARYVVPDFLHNSLSLAVVLGAFAGANALQHESGLLAVTVMGIALATQRITPVRHVLEFKESLRTLLIAGLFIVLAARVDLTDLTDLGLRGLAFLVLVLLVRGVAVAVATVRTGLSWRERAFLSWVAPRGIVAASVASVFALRLAEDGVPGAELLVPVTFAVIVGTIAIYGPTASALARRLGLSDENPQGVLFVGAHAWARRLAKALHDEGFPVVLADTDWGNLSAARMEGLPVFYGSALSDEALHGIDLAGIGRLFAVTSNDGVNALAAQRWAHAFGRAEVYQLAPKTRRARRLAMPADLRGRVLFDDDLTFEEITRRVEEGAAIKVTRLSEEFDVAAFRTTYGEEAVPLVIIPQAGTLVPCAGDRAPAPRPGHVVVSLVPARDREPRVPSPAE